MNPANADTFECLSGGDSAIVAMQYLPATSVHDGHGHAYRSEYVDAWNAVLQPQGITAGDLAELESRAAATR